MTIYDLWLDRNYTNTSCCIRPGGPMLSVCVVWRLQTTLLLIDTDNTWCRRDWYLIADGCRWCWYVLLVLVTVTWWRRGCHGYLLLVLKMILIHASCTCYGYLLLVYQMILIHVALLVHSCYIDSEQTARKTQLPTIRLLRMYLLLGSALTDRLHSNCCRFWFHCWGFQHSANTSPCISAVGT
jgi:hypothetical protein